MKKILIVICVFFSLFLTGCNSIEEEFDIIENNIKSSIPESIEGDIVLPTEDLTYNATISWKSSNEEVLTSVGENKNKLLKTDVTLTYTINIKNKQREGTIVVAVNANKYLLQLDRVEFLMLEKIPEVVCENLNLPKENPSYKAQIEWKSSNEEILTIEGVNKNQTPEIIDVTLSYKITIDGYVKEGEKQVKVSANKITTDLNAIEETIKNLIPQTTVDDITLITEVYSMKAKINWASSNEKVISLEGKVLNYKENPVVVTLTYTIIIGEAQKIGTVQVEVPCTENYTYKLDSEVYYIGVNCIPELFGKVYRNGEYYYGADFGYKIIGEYDNTKPGTYELKASVEMSVKKEDENGNINVEKITLEDSFVLEILGLDKVNMKEIKEHSLTTSNYAFGINNYYIICSEDLLTIYDLNNLNEYKTIKINGLCNSYHYKNGYLYISSCEPYDDPFAGDFTGYVSQINLETNEMIKEYKVNFAPYSIVIDKRNNAILSKEQNQHIMLEYLNMNTGNLKEISSAYQEDIIIYNEEEDSFILVGTMRTLKGNLYKYDSQIDNFVLQEIQTSMREEFDDYASVIEKNKNTWVHIGQVIKYVILENNDIKTQDIILPEWEHIFYPQAYAYIDDECITVLRYSKYENIGYLTTYNKETQEYKNYKIENFITSTFTDLHMYNDKIYMFDSKLGKLYIVE